MKVGNARANGAVAQAGGAIGEQSIDRSDRLRRAFAAVSPACIALALATLLLPVLLVEYPPLLDYPNHLARIWLLSGGLEQSPLDTMYSVDWRGASTNIGIDLLATTVGRLTGGIALARVLLALAVVLPVLGIVLLNRVVFGGWHWWQTGFAVLAWNTTLLAGFLNFQIGLGLALIAAAGDQVVRHRVKPVPLALVRICAGSLLLVVHAFAAGFYGVLLAGLVFGAGHQAFASRRSLAQTVLRCLAAGGSSLGLPLALFFTVAPIVPGGHAPAGIYDPWDGYTLINKIGTLMSAFATYDLRLDVAAILVLWAVARLVPSTVVLRAHAGLLLAASGLLLLALLVPSSIAGTAFIDWRFPIMALLTATAAVRPGFRTHRSSAMAATALLLVGIMRTAWIGSVWVEREADINAVREALSVVPAGAAVLPVEAQADDVRAEPRGRYLNGGLPSYWHYATLAVPWRHAFVPTLFTAPGKQPLRVRPAWRAMSVLEGIPAPVDALFHFEPTPRSRYGIGYVENWRNRFDYVLVVNADMNGQAAEASLPDLELLGDKGFARIYRVIQATRGSETRSPGTGETRLLASPGAAPTAP